MSFYSQSVLSNQFFNRLVKYDGYCKYCFNNYHIPSHLPINIKSVGSQLSLQYPIPYSTLAFQKPKEKPMGVRERDGPGSVSCGLIGPKKFKWLIFCLWDSFLRFETQKEVHFVPCFAVFCQQNGSGTISRLKQGQREGGGGRRRRRRRDVLQYQSRFLSIEKISICIDKPLWTLCVTSQSNCMQQMHSDAALGIHDSVFRDKKAIMIGWMMQNINGRGTGGNEHWTIIIKRL